MNFKKQSYITAVLLMLTVLSFGQKRAKAERDTRNWRYELECAGIGKPGTKLVKVYSYSKKSKVALAQAKKNAIHGIIFRGYAGGTSGCTNQRALARDPELEIKKQEFFKAFFADGGKYLKFATSSGDASRDIVKIGKEYKVGVVVVIQMDLLRKDLEAAGIIKGLSSGF